VRTEWGITDDVPVIGWLGRLDRKKRVEDVLTAAAALAQQRPQVRWVIVGGPNFFYPEHEGELHRLADQLGLRDTLRWLGDRDDVPRLLAGLDALVWLSEGEGMPHVLAEAAACPSSSRATTAPSSRSSTARQGCSSSSGTRLPSPTP